MLEFRYEDALSFSLEARKLNDIWVYKILLSAVTKYINESQDADFLLEVVINITNDRPELRIGLFNIISKLQRLDSETFYIY